MATKTFEELRKLAIQIRDEKANKQNTALRIGNFLLSSLDKMESMDIADIAEAVLQAETAADEAKRQADIVAQSSDIVEEAIKQGAAAEAAAAAANAAADKATNEGLFKTQQNLSEEEQGQVKRNLGIEDLMASLETQTIEGFSETVNATTSTKSVDNIIPPSIDFAIVDLGSTDGRELPTTPSMSVVLAKVTDDGRVKMQGYLKTSHEEYNIQVVSGSAEKYALNVNIITDIETTYKVFQIRYLSSSDGGKFKGSYGELSQLQAAYPTAGNGSYAFVGNPRHLYEWVTNAWTDRGEFITNVDQAIDAQSERAVSNKAVSVKLTELDFKNSLSATIPTKGNLLDKNRIIKGFYIGEGGKPVQNEIYGYVIIPMFGQSIITNTMGGYNLAAYNEKGQVTHLKGDNNLSNKNILPYQEGDVYAAISLQISNIDNTLIGYGEELPQNTTGGYATNLDLNVEKGRILTLEKKQQTNEEYFAEVGIENYKYSQEIESLSVINKNVISDMLIKAGDKLILKVEGTSEWSRCLFQCKSPSNEEQRFDNLLNGEIREVEANMDIERMDLYLSPTSLGDINLSISKKGELQSLDLRIKTLEDEYNNPQKSINGERINDKSISYEKLGEDFLQYSKNLFNEEKATKGYFLTGQGEFQANEAYWTSDFIPFTEEVGNLTASLNGKGLDGGAHTCLYSKDKAFIKAFMNSEYKGKVSWEEGVAFARFSANTSNYKTFQIEKGSEITSYEPFSAKVKSEFLPEIPDATKLNISFSLLGENCIIGNKESLNDSEIFEIENFPMHIKKRNIFSFECDITSFNEIIIGKGFEQYRGRYIKIDNTNITLAAYDGGESQKAQTAHGLTISDFIKLSMYTDNSGYLYIILFTKSGILKYTFDKWEYEANYKPFVKSNGSVLTNVRLTAGCQDFQRPIWAFGDSYFGIATNRWPGVIRDLGFFNFYLNGLAGQGSAGAYNELLKSLEFGTPKWIFWCLGMNDNDETFKQYFDNVKLLCQNKGIEMIASTIPSVPERSKENINTYVKESGVRYVDFYKAVGATPEGTWYDGYLSFDDVHPDNLGAQALAMQVLIDFPEIMQYGLISTSSEIGDITGDK